MAVKTLKLRTQMENTQSLHMVIFCPYIRHLNDMTARTAWGSQAR